MERRLRTRLRVEVLLAAISAGLFVLTLINAEWIEALTGLEPDAGSGALEFLIAAAFLVAAVVTALMARRDYRQLASLDR
jgi:hypothetical protein